jgi:hypothetical protein
MIRCTRSTRSRRARRVPRGPTVVVADANHLLAAKQEIGSKFVQMYNEFFGASSHVYNADQAGRRNRSVSSPAEHAPSRSSTSSTRR